MPVRRLPVRPDLDQLHRQAKELLRAIHGGDSNAIAELREYHPESIDAPTAKLADAQVVLDQLRRRQQGRQQFAAYRLQGPSMRRCRYVHRRDHPAVAVADGRR